MSVIRYLAEEDAGDYLCMIRIEGVQWSEWPKRLENQRSKYVLVLKIY